MTKGPSTRPTSAAAGYHATSPTGTKDSRLASAKAGSPSSGKTLSCVISRQVELLTSSAARGAQKARLPQPYEKASTIVTDEARYTSSKPSQPAETCTLKWPIDQAMVNRPGSTMPAPVI